ncbi:MAG: aminotransferase class V-fold PLP-dependent enzyme [Deltaproteobacteria bacterium]|nr:aminotransferase class V-fold PLP-dependent enzyme [Deltaproteobacteria bacterium]
MTDRFVYLDNAATSWPKPPEVAVAMERFLRDSAGNPGRAGHRLALAAQIPIDDCRAALARLLGAPDASRVAFTLNASDALNMALKGVLRDGDRVVTSRMEHNSVNRPLAALAAAGRIAVDVAENDGEGRIDPDSVRRLLRPGGTRLLALTWASNAFGTLQPVAEFAAAAREAGALLLLDASQAVGAVPLDLAGCGADLVAFPGHKGLMGPTGTGALWVRGGLDVAPWREGGTGGDSTDPFQPREMPHRLEGGTPNTVGIAGLLAGVRWVAARGVAEIRRHERDLTARIIGALSAVPGVAIHGPRDAEARIAAVSFTIPGHPPQEVAAALDAAFGVAVRPGLHCAPHAHRSLGTFPDGTVRASPGPFSTEADVDALAAAVGKVAGT